MLLRLPPELRDHIFKYVFLGTRLTFSRYTGNYVESVPLIPAPHSLALLRTCYQIYGETRELWISYVTFNFHCLESMLDKFFCVSPDTVSRIKFVCVGGKPVRLRSMFGENDLCYTISWALKFLPELNLDVLTVLGMTSGAAAYDALQGLIKYGNGWRELHFITPTSGMLGFAQRGSYRRKPQPSTWTSMLQKREERTSPYENGQATVKIYRATKLNSENEPSGNVLCPATRELFEQDVEDSAEDCASFGVKKDMTLMAPNEIEKELLVIVKRAGAAGYAKDSERLECYDDPRDIRFPANTLIPFHTWPSIRQVFFEWREGIRPLVDKWKKTDVYYNVFDFHWSFYCT